MSPRRARKPVDPRNDDPLDNLDNLGLSPDH